MRKRRRAQLPETPTAMRATVGAGQPRREWPAGADPIAALGSEQALATVCSGPDKRPEVQRTVPQPEVEWARPMWRTPEVCQESTLEAAPL